MGTEIHKTAIVDPGAELGIDVNVGPYNYIGPNVRIGDGTRIGPQVVIDGVTSIGARNHIVGQASIGADPQDISYRGEPTQVEIGDGNMIREFVTINRGTLKGGALTKVGDGCLLMACSHIAHDCLIEDKVILANNVMLAGHVHIGKGANISGAVGAHHFVTVGDYAYVGGMTRIERDVPPFMIIEGRRSRVRNVNSVGLQRAGFSESDIEHLRVAFRKIYRSKDPQLVALEALRAETDIPEIVQVLIKSLQLSEEGRKGRYREGRREEFAKEGAARLAAGIR
ncbi:MAG: UDP-N-acetylglucosamine acyltransferase [Planctomycetota bacterium]|jgi:UDP-N-acetylglucosamine acyltransferase